MRVLVVVTLLVGCGGAAPDGGRVRRELSCTESGSSGEPACVARGCSWGPAPWCSGVAAADESFTHDETRPCECTCEADLLACASRP